MAQRLCGIRATQERAAPLQYKSAVVGATGLEPVTFRM